MPGGVGVGAGAGVAGAGACDDASAGVVVGATKRVAEGPEIDMIVYGPLDWEQSCSRREKNLECKTRSNVGPVTGLRISYC